MPKLPLGRDLWPELARTFAMNSAFNLSQHCQPLPMCIRSMCRPANWNAGLSARPGGLNPANFRAARTDPLEVLG